MTHPTLLEGIASLRPSDRARLSHLELAPTENGWQVTLHALDSVIGQGDLDLEPTLEQQATALADSGLCGGIAWGQNECAQLAWLWSANPTQRADWQSRQDQAAASPQASAVVVAGDAVRAAAWRHREALVALRDAARGAAGARELDHATIAKLSGLTHDDVETALTPSTPTNVANQPHAPNLTPAPTPSTGLVRMPMGHSAPCIICRTPATTTLGEVAVHPAECLRQYRERDTERDAHVEAEAAATPSSTAPAAAQRAETRPARAVKTSATTPPTPGPKRDRSRFAAAVAAWDGRTLYLPGTQQPWNGAHHLGDVALLVKDHQLGHGGGAALPDRGEIWLYPDALAALGLPAQADIARGHDAKTRAAAREETFGPMTALPAVQDAIAAGWVIDGGRIDVRTRIKHPDLLPGGAQIIALPWTDIGGQALLTKGMRGQDLLTPAAPEVLVRRLQDAADLIGLTWRVSPGQTGVDLIDTLRPPLREGQESGHKERLTYGREHELPSFLKARGRDLRFREIERVFSWWRPWEELLEEERGRRYAIAYDHGSHFLNPYTSTELGLGGIKHLTGVAARWDGSERPGYWVVSKWATPTWALPDPANGGGVAVAEDKILVTAHTLRQLAKLDPALPDSLTYYEAWVWTDTARYLEQVGQRLGQARDHGSPEVAAAVKQIYAHLTQKIASVDKPPPQVHLRAPDWRDMLVAAARTGLLSTLITNRDHSGALPLVVTMDTIVYAVDSDDPRAAWPGRAQKYGTGRGQWKPIGIAPLDQWGPHALPAHGLENLRFDYANITKAMTALNPVTGHPREKGER